MVGTVQPVILSHKRAGTITTHEHVANAVVCIPASQAADYERAYPNLPQLVHPDSVVGLWAKRDWVKNQVGDHIQLDDDSDGIYRVYRALHGWKKSIMSADRAYDLIQRTGERARAFGAHFFGFAMHAHPLTYNGLKPFRFGGYTPGGALGILEGCKVWWPTDTTLGDGDDYWCCLLNYHYHRYAFFDRRFAFGFRGTYTAGGGLSDFRAGGLGKRKGETVDPVLAHLQKNFGREVIVRNYDGPNAATRHIKNPSRRSIVMPYRT